MSSANRGSGPVSETRPEEGVICAFQLAPPQRLAGDVLTERQPPTPRWLHLNLADNRICRWIENRAGLPEEARALLLDTEPRVRVENLQQGVAVALGDLHHDFDDDPEGFGMLRVYLDPERIVTARRRPIKSIGLVHARIDASSRARDTTELFEMVLRGHDEAVSAVVRRFADAVDDAEDAVLAGHIKEQGSTLGRIRRLLARLRRHLNANSAVVAQLLADPPAFWLQEHLELIRSCEERLEATAQDVELVSERARLLQDEIASRLNEATNKNLYLLSTLTTVLLPINLVTGIFGMNLHGMPLAEQSHGFAIVMGVILGGVVGAMYLLRRRDIA